MTIREIFEIEEAHMKLLLTADPSEENVKKYLNNGRILGGYIDNDLVGIYILIKVSQDTFEIANIAVEELHQGKGYAKEMIRDAISNSKVWGANKLMIGTGNSSINQLALYQKCGFRIIGVERDFFIKNYDEPIFENGIPCVDMIRLSMDI